MLSYPGAFFYWGGQMYPVSQNEWYMFSTKQQAQTVLALLQKNFPTGTFNLVSGTQTGQTDGLFVPPLSNPANIDIWLIQGTVPGQDNATPPNNVNLTFNEYAGSLFDRGPAAQGFGGAPLFMVDDSNGTNLTYKNCGYGYSAAGWRVNPTPVLQDPQLPYVANASPLI